MMIMGFTNIGKHIKDMAIGAAIGAVKKGDRVLFESYAGTALKVEGDEYLMMREDDVLAVIE